MITQNVVYLHIPILIVMNLKTRLTNWITTILGTAVALVSMFVFFGVIPSTLFWISIVEMLAIICGVVLIFSRL